ncbi:MAG: CRISPR-associated endonuclease Cas2 [Candidatus Competibacterales bacterium]|nr:CRISPR-associated endonuclease Cas2 [Candidatus Competibacterales bacterium]
MRRALYLIAYDIADPHRLNRVARFLTKCAVRIQYSVFAAEFTRTQLDDTLEGLRALIDPREDDIRAYPLPRVGQVALMGRQLFPDDILLLRDGYNLLRLRIQTRSQDEG